MFCWPAPLYNLANKAHLLHNFSWYIYFLYMFRATMCPSSEETTVSMRHLVFVSLVCRVEFHSTLHTRRLSIQNDKIPSVA
jgi:hypothetical protein